MMPRFWSLVLSGTLGMASCVPAATPARPSPDTETSVTPAAGPAHRVVLVAGAKSHGPRVHEYIKTVRLLKAMLDNAQNVSGIRTDVYLNGWPEDAAALARADAQPRRYSDTHAEVSECVVVAALPCSRYSSPYFASPTFGSSVRRRRACIPIHPACSSLTG